MTGWTPDRLRALGSTVRMQAWPIADEVKSALDACANFIELLQKPVKNRSYYDDEATRLIGFASCGYLNTRDYRRIHQRLTDALVNEAMALQAEADAIEELQACRELAKEHAVTPAASEA